MSDSPTRPEAASLLAAPTYPRSAEPGAAFRYFAWLYSPVTERGSVQALFAIEAEIGTSLRAGLDHNVAHMRLQWWRDELDRVVAGRAVHPLTRALNDSARGACLQGLIDTAIWDLACATFQTRQELTHYCDRWASAMIGETAKTLGIALREIEMLLNLHRDAQSGRVRVPLDELERIGIAPDCVARLPWPEPLANLLRDRFSALHTDISNSITPLDERSRSRLRGVLVWAALAQRQIERAQRALPDLRRASRLEPIAQAWAAWRAARHAPEAHP